MALVLNTNTKRMILLDQTHEVFEGSDFAKAEFEVVVVPLTSSQRGELNKRFTTQKRGAEVVDHTGFLKAVFDQTVTDWTGVSFGEGDVPCNRENKGIVFETNFDFASRIVEASRMEQERIESRRSDEAKN